MPVPSALLLITELLVTVSAPLLSIPPPKASLAEEKFPSMVEVVTEAAPVSLIYIAPPLDVPPPPEQQSPLAELLEIFEFNRVKTPVVAIPPP